MFGSRGVARRASAFDLPHSSPQVDTYLSRLKIVENVQHAIEGQLPSWTATLVDFLLVIWDQ